MFQKIDKKFELVSKFDPSGDQKDAIKKLSKGLDEGKKWQTLLGATGTGKTFTMANIINETQRPALVLAHNKTLAAQLASEFKEFFPNNAVNYFISYYDYYQPEAYIAKSDTYIEKDASINEEIDKYRHKATVDLLTRNDVIIVASVSCIYGLGSPKEYIDASIVITKSDILDRDDFMRKLTEMQYIRNDMAFERGRFRTRGDVVEFWPPWSDYSIRIEFFDRDIDRLDRIDPLTGEIIENLEVVMIPPAKHAVVGEVTLQGALNFIKTELEEQYALLRANGKEVEAQRLKQRTEYDIEMLKETGFVSGIENYSLYMSDRWKPDNKLANSSSKLRKFYKYHIGIKIPENIYNIWESVLSDIVINENLKVIDSENTSFITLIAPFETNESLSSIKETIINAIPKKEEIEIKYDNHISNQNGKKREDLKIDILENKDLLELQKALGEDMVKITKSFNDNKSLSTTICYTSKKDLKNLSSLLNKYLYQKIEGFSTKEICLVRSDPSQKNPNWEIVAKFDFTTKQIIDLQEERDESMNEFIPYPHGECKPPYTLLHFFPKDFITFIDESHITLPQLGAMYEGNLSRKNELIKYGFRLPSCRENRPLVIEETTSIIGQVVFVSATPGQKELEYSNGINAEQVIRPTGLLDPIVKIHPTKGQIDDILEEILECRKRDERAIITTLTKKMAEELSDYLEGYDIKVKYLHSDLDAIERVEILRDLRLGKIECIVGINLLREGLDLPEISFIGILDADKQGFLRSRDSLVQIIGRAARNENGHVKLYCDAPSRAVTEAMSETERRRKIQMQYNEEHNITPKTIKKEIRDTGFESRDKKDSFNKDILLKGLDNKSKIIAKIAELESEMTISANNWDFEKASELRDEIIFLKQKIDK